MLEFAKLLGLFFDASDAIDAGTSLGIFFVQIVAPQLRTNPENQNKVIEAFLNYANVVIRGLKLGLLKKSQLFLHFKSTIQESGSDSKFSSSLTFDLIRYAGHPVDAHSESPPASLLRSNTKLLSDAANHLKHGRLPKAIAIYQTIIKRFPDNHVAWSNLGQAHLLQGNIDQAETCFRAAILLEPSHIEAYNNLGIALAEAGRFKNAESVIRLSLKIKPDQPDALYSLGLINFNLNRPNEAEAHYQEALKFTEHSLALVGLSEIAASDGKYELAESLCRRALATQPGFPPAWARLADLRKMTIADSQWLGETERMIRGPIAPIDKRLLLFAMGKFYDDIGAFDQAFDHYRRANELSKLVFPKYDPQKMQATAARIIERNDSGHLAAAASTGNPSQLPVFIIGMPRSGTSLVEQIIASHPDACGAGELLFWTEAANNLDSGDDGLLPDKSTIKSLAKEYQKLLSELAQGKRRVVDKSPINFMNVGLIHQAFPKARIVHTYRNPADNCLSIYFQNFSAAHNYSADLSEIKHFYNIYRLLMKHWHTVLPKGTILDVPYEELLDDPETWIRRIIDFLGIEWDERCLNFQDTERKVVTASHWQVRQKLYKTSAGRWRNYEKHIGALRELFEPA